MKVKVLLQFVCPGDKEGNTATIDKVAGEPENKTNNSLSVWFKALTAVQFCVFSCVKVVLDCSPPKDELVSSSETIYGSSKYSNQEEKKHVFVCFP